MKKTFKKVISLCIIFAMLMSQFAVLSSATNTDDTYHVITAGEIKSVNIENGGDYCYFSFTPETDGVYIFTSNSEDDTYGYLYDADMNQLACDDDGGVSSNFSIGYQFEAGKKYIFGCRYYNSDKTGFFNVSLVEVPTIVSITAVAKKTLIENYDGYDDGDYYYYYIDNCNPEYTVMLKDGTVYTGNRDAIKEAIGYYPDIYIEQSTEHPLTVGKHTAQVSILGVQGTCEIEIVETPVASITAVAKKTLIENYDGYDDGDYYYYYIGNCNLEYTVTLKDGMVYTGENWEIENEFGYRPSISINQSSEEPLTVGKHTAQVSILGVQGTCEIEIVETPVASITAVATETLIENYNGSDYGEYYYYYIDNCNPEYTVTLKDGMVYTGKNWEIRDAVGYYPDIYIEQSTEHPLTVGKHTAEVSIAGVTGTCEIEIISILNVTVKTKAIRFGIETYDSDPEYTVTLSNGTVYTGDGYDISNAIGAYPSIDWKKENQKVGANIGVVDLAGKEFPFEYQILENPYKTLEIISVKPMLEEKYYDEPQITYKLTKKDGMVEIRDNYSSWHPDSETFSVSIEKIGEWKVGKDNKFTLEVAGLTSVGSVEILPNEYSYTLLDDKYAIITGTINETETLTIPEKIDGYTVIGISRLELCSGTKKVILPDSVKYLAKYWIDSDYVEQIVIGAGVQNLDNEMFKYLSGLKSIEVSESNSFYKSFKGAVYTKDMSTLVAYPVGGDKNYVIPAETSNIDILKDAFYDGIIINGAENTSNFIVKDGVTYSADMRKIIFCNVEKSGSYVMPESVEEIGKRAFSGCNKLENISVSNNVTDIVYGTFADCTALKNITLPNSIESIGKQAFAKCEALKSITIPNSVTSIGFETFYGCTSLTSAVIGNSVTSIDSDAFRACTSLESITIPDSVTSIGGSVFENCTSLTSAVIGNSVTSIDSDAFRACTSLESITIPDSVTSIGGSVFENCTSLTSVTIGNSVTNIYYSAFENCTSLKNITIPDSVTSIGGSVFENCTSLISAVIGNSVTSIDSYAFRDCNSLASITIPDSVTSIGSSAFSGCTSLASITIPDSVTSIERYAFSDTAYYNDESNWENDVLYIGNHLIKAKGTISGEYSIKEGTKTVADEAFDGCTSLTSVTIPGSVTSIGYEAFKDCTSLTSVTIPDSVTNIGAYAFYNCPLGELKLPKGIEHIGGGAFSNTNVTSIEIPDTVTDMVYSFRGSNVSEIKMPDKLISMYCDFDDTPWYDSQPNGPIYLGRMLYGYKGWMNDYSDITVKDGTLGISGGAFANQNNLVNIILPEGLLEIGENAFRDCCRLNSPVLPSTLKTIKENAFYDCESIDVINIPASVTEIAVNAFEGSGLKEINVAADNPVYSSIDGVLYNKDGTELIYCPRGKTGTLVLPEQTVKMRYIERSNLLSAIVITNDKQLGFAYSFGVQVWYGKEGTLIQDKCPVVFIPLNNLTDEATNISISEDVPNNIIQGSVLTIENVVKTENKVSYNITLTKDGKTVQPNGEVTVKIPVPETMNAENCKVYREESDGTYTDMNAVCIDGFMVFTTDHFSVYMLTTGNPNELLGDVNGDEIVDAADAVMIQRYDAGLAKLTAEQLSVADVNCDGIVDAADAVKIQRYDAGLIDKI